MSVDLKELVSEVRRKDLRHNTINYDSSYTKDAEEEAWRNRQQARKNLRDAIYELTGVGISELQTLTTC